MRYEPAQRVRFSHQLSIKLTPELHRAVHKAAGDLGLTSADYLRLATAERLAADGVQVASMPILSTTRIDHLRRSAVGKVDQTETHSMKLESDARDFGAECAEMVLASASTDMTVDPNEVADRAVRCLAAGVTGVAMEFGSAAAADWRAAAMRAFRDRIASARRDFFQVEPGGAAA